MKNTKTVFLHEILTEYTKETSDVNIRKQEQELQIRPTSKAATSWHNASKFCKHWGTNKDTVIFFLRLRSFKQTRNRRQQDKTKFLTSISELETGISSHNTPQTGRRSLAISINNREHAQLPAVTEVGEQFTTPCNYPQTLVRTGSCHDRAQNSWMKLYQEGARRLDCWWEFSGPPIVTPDAWRGQSPITWAIPTSQFLNFASAQRSTSIICTHKLRNEAAGSEANVWSCLIPLHFFL